MTDQAEGLRKLVMERESRGRGGARPTPSVTTRSLVLTSGKGGVGTSNLALNLALALGEMGRRVLLVDADFGLANLDLLCGLSPARDLGDVLAGEATLAEAIVEAPFGVMIVPGVHATRTLHEWLDEAPERLVSGLATLEEGAEFVIVDAGSGLKPSVARLAASADEVAVVTTPEPTSLADAHATIGGLRRRPGLRLRVLVNQVHSASEGRDVLDQVALASRQFLGASVRPLGQVRHDPRVPRAVRARRPFLLAAPSGPASRGVRRLARSWAAEARPPAERSHEGGFFAKWAARWVPGLSAR